MKKIYTGIISLFFAFGAMAQDTLHSQDFPTAGHTYVLSIGTSFSGIDIVSTGNNFNWDFSGLGRTSQRIDTILDPNNTNPLLGFYFINSQFNANRSNQATHGNGFTVGTIGFSGVYNYYYNGTTNYSQPGFGAVVNGAPIPIPYTPHDIIYRFPLAFGLEDSVAYQYEVDLTAIVGIYVNVKRQRHNTVDGKGTLTTPYGTFDVLRVKSVIIERDSLYIDTFLHQGVSLPPDTTIEYKWLGVGAGLPLLQVNTRANNTITSIVYQDSARVIGIDQLLPIRSDVKVYPNPVSYYLIVSYSLRSMSDIEYRLYDMEGRSVYENQKVRQPAGDNYDILDLSSLNLGDGNYILTISSGTNSVSKKISLQKE